MKTFRRKIYSDLLEWKSGGGATAPLIEGARRVGKTATALEFARNEYDSYMLIDFSKADEATRRWFRECSEDLDTLFNRLQPKYRRGLYERRSLVIFDEVRLFPFARQMVKHLVADGAYVVHTKDLRVDGEVVYLPLYMLPFIDGATSETL